MMDLFAPSESAPALRDCSKEGYGADLRNLPKTKSEAKRLGIRYYFTGNPCPQGHNVARYTLGGRCCFCSREKSAERNGTVFKCTMPKALSHAARTKAANIGQTTYVPVRPCPKGHRLRFVASTNCVECDKLARLRDSQKRKEARVLKLYNLSPEEHDAMFERQGARCGICEEMHESKWQMHIDHCHSTNRVRGLLCSCCNQALGLLKEKKELFLKAVEYLNA